MPFNTLRPCRAPLGTALLTAPAPCTGRATRPDPVSGARPTNESRSGHSIRDCDLRRTNSFTRVRKVAALRRIRDGAHRRGPSMGHLAHIPYAPRTKLCVGLLALRSRFTHSFLMPLRAAYYATHSQKSGNTFVIIEVAARFVDRAPLR